MASENVGLIPLILDGLGLYRRFSTCEYGCDIPEERSFRPLFDFDPYFSGSCCSKLEKEHSCCRKTTSDKVYHAPQVDFDPYETTNPITAENNSEKPINYALLRTATYDPYNPQAKMVTQEKPKEEQKPKANNDEAVTSIDQKGFDTTPSWYEALKNKVDKKQNLNPNELKLKTNYENLLRKYSPYQLDASGNYIFQPDGTRKTNALANEIRAIYNLSQGWGTNIGAISAKLRSMSAEQLAALEHYFPQFAEGKTLREVIKDSSSVWGFRWLNINYNSAESLFDYIDQKTAMINPSNMAKSLYQCLNNHRIGGFGVDDERIIKLLRYTQNNKEFLMAVKEEYSQAGAGATILEEDINSKWGISSDKKQMILSLLN